MNNNVKQCVNCKQSRLLYKNFSNEVIKFWEGFITAQPNKYRLEAFCPDITLESYIDGYNNDLCPFCKSPLIDTLININDFRAIANISQRNREFLLAMIELRKTDIIEFETKMLPFRQAYEKKQQESEAETRRIAESKSNQITCPKCGCTNITSGTRGFTLTTGFLGSGNHRNVCVKCGYKWKPGGWSEALNRDLHGHR